jgi:hypothetical protein
LIVAATADIWTAADLIQQVRRLRTRQWSSAFRWAPHSDTTSKRHGASVAGPGKNGDDSLIATHRDSLPRYGLCSTDLLLCFPT